MAEARGSELRLRMIAGPNGSGKSTFFARLQKNVSTGFWINADEILFEFERRGFIDYDWLGFAPNQHSWYEFIKLQSSNQFIAAFHLEQTIASVVNGEYSFSIGKKNVSNAMAAFVADYFRYYLLKSQKSFTTETVFSHPSKLELISQSIEAGYKTYLYFIATEAPALNISRIKGRLEKGGHAVPDDIVTARYYRSIDLVTKSLSQFFRVFIFDNSSLNLKLLASYHQGNLMEVTNQPLPEWSKKIINT